MYHHISKHLEVRQKYSAARHIFNSNLGVWKCDETLSLVCDILHPKLVSVEMACTNTTTPWNVAKTVSKKLFATM